MADRPPLEGIRILDLTHMLAGPYATMLLGDLGAEVVKIETPDRPDRARSVPPWRVGDQSAYYLSLNRNKKSATLDLKTADGRDGFLDLVAGADVVFENFRPGVAERLGIDHAALKARNPRIVVCSLSGFGHTGPWRDRPAYDYLVQALTGTMSITGAPGGAPTKYGVSIVDHVGGLFAVIGILSAVIAQGSDDGDGAGRAVDVSLFDSHLSLLSYLAGWQLNCGAAPARQPSSSHPTLVPSQVFETADGHLVVMVLADHFWAPLCKAVDLPELGEDPRFGDATGRLEHRVELIAVLEQRLRAHGTSHWVDVLVAAGVPAAPVLSVPEALETEQVQARDMVIDLHHPQYGSYRAVGNPVKISGSGEPPARPAPLLGEHTAELLHAAAQVRAPAPRTAGEDGRDTAAPADRPAPAAELTDQATRVGLDLEVRNAALELFINRPERRNVLHPAVVRVILDALDWAAGQDAIRCVLLGGRGDAFCAGYDIGDIGAGERAGVERDLVDDLATRIEQFALPVVAAVHGSAIGGGCDLAVACDIRLGSTTARLGMPPARLGLLYAPDGMRRLLQRAGESTAREMLLTGTPVDAERAWQAGLLSEVVADGELLERARAVCDRLAANAPLSVAGTKRSLGLLATAPPGAADARAELAQIQHRVWHSADAIEGPQAYRERRTPHFVGC